MKLSKKEIIIITVVLVLLVSYIFFKDDIKGYFEKRKLAGAGSGATATNTGGATSTGSGATTTTGGGNVQPPAINPIIGKTVYAKYNDVKVFKKAGTTLYKIAKLNDWIGEVDEVLPNGFLVVNTYYMVYKDLVKTK